MFPNVVTEKYVHKHLGVWIKDKIDGTGKKMYEDSRYIHFIVKTHIYVILKVYGIICFSLNGNPLMSRLKAGIKVCLK